MKFLLLIFLSIHTTLLFAQKVNTFSMQINQRNVLKTQKIPQNESIKVNIPKQKIIAKCVIAITINELDPNSKWHRVFIISNEQGQEVDRKVFKTTNGTFTMQLKLPDAIKIIKISTLTEPNDPNEAALIRLRTFPLVDVSIL